MFVNDGYRDESVVWGYRYLMDGDNEDSLHGLGGTYQGRVLYHALWLM